MTTPAIRPPINFSDPFERSDRALAGDNGWVPLANPPVKPGITTLPGHWEGSYWPDGQAGGVNPDGSYQNPDGTYGNWWIQGEFGYGTNDGTFVLGFQNWVATFNGSTFAPTIQMTDDFGGNVEVTPSGSALATTVSGQPVRQQSFSFHRPPPTHPRFIDVMYGTTLMARFVLEGDYVAKTGATLGIVDGKAKITDLGTLTGGDIDRLLHGGYDLDVPRAGVLRPDTPAQDGLWRATALVEVSGRANSGAGFVLVVAANQEGTLGVTLNATTDGYLYVSQWDPPAHAYVFWGDTHGLSLTTADVGTQVRYTLEFNPTTLAVTAYENDVKVIDVVMDETGYGQGPRPLGTMSGFQTSSYGDDYWLIEEYGYDIPVIPATPYEEPPPETGISHHFTFSAVALKDLPEYLLDFGGGDVALDPTVVPAPAVGGLTVTAPAGTVTA